MIRRLIALMTAQPWCHGRPLKVGDRVRHTVTLPSGEVAIADLEVAYFTEKLVFFTDRTHAKKTPTMDWLERIEDRSAL